MPLLPALSLFLSAAGLGTFWKTQALRAVDPALLRFYPFLWLWTPALVVFLVFLAVWSALTALDDKHRPLRHAVPFAVFLSPWLGVSLTHAFFAYLLLESPTGLRFARRFPYWTPFLLILVSQALFNSFCGPASWKTPISSLHKGESLTLALSSALRLNSLLAAKHWSLSAFDSSFWASLPYSPTSNFSPILAILSRTLDWPTAIDSSCRILLIFHFVWCVASSFGFYLFCRRALALRDWIATVGGILFLPSNGALGLLFTSRFPLFHGPFLMLPYALLFASLAVEKKSARWAAASGVALGSIVFLLQPHPDALAHAAVAWVLYWTWLGLGRRSSLSLGLVALACFGAEALACYGPLFESVFRREAFFFGHREGFFAHSARDWYFQVVWPITRYCLFLMWPLLFNVRRWFSPGNAPRARLFFPALVIALILFCAQGKEGALAHWLSVHSPLSLLSLSRALAYACLGALVTCLLALESLEDSPRGPGHWLAATFPLYLAWHLKGAALLSMGPTPWLFGLGLILVYRRNTLVLATPAIVMLLFFSSHGEWQSPRLLAPASLPLASHSAYNELPQLDTWKALESVPHPHGRLLGATGANDLLGFDGEALQNPTTIVDTRFLTVFPPLQALYLHPGEFYRSTGTYAGVRPPWLTGIEAVASPHTRRLLELGGIDHFLVDTLTLERSLSDAKRRKAGLRRLPIPLPGSVSTLLEDTRAAGTAYLAKQLFVRPRRSQFFFANHPPFGPTESRRFSNYVALTERLQSELVRLPRGGVILESDGPSRTETAGRGALLEQHLVHEHGSFLVRCEVEPCVLVVNLASLSAWRVFVDDTRVAPGTANYAFLAVNVPSGTHRVWLEYRPWCEIPCLFLALFVLNIPLFNRLRHTVSARPAGDNLEGEKPWPIAPPEPAV